MNVENKINKIAKILKEKGGDYIQLYTTTKK